MLVKEIFVSIQGESSFSGIPCLFIRTSGCNLRCTWCDTTYAYEGGEELSPEFLESQVKKSPYHLVSLTGGEPLQQKDSIETLSRIAGIKDKTVILETNGSLSIKDVDKRVVKVVDVKCPSSGTEESFLNDNINFISKNDEIKFVIAGREDYSWACNFIKDSGITNYFSIYFSPLTDKLKPSILARWIIEDRLNVRLQLQLHKIIWPDKQRGV